MNSKAKTIAINGILIALMVVMTCTMLVTGGMAILPLLVLVVGSVLMGKWTALILSFVFGLISFISSFIFPTPTAPIFQNPLVSILPRILIGLIGCGVFNLSEFVFKKINLKAKKQVNEYLSKCVSTILSAIFVVLFNTLLVVTMICLIYLNKELSSGFFVSTEFVLGLIGLNFVVEIIVVPIISAPIVFAVDKFLKKNKKEVLTEEDMEVLNIGEDSIDNIAMNVEDGAYNIDIDTSEAKDNITTISDNNTKDNIATNTDNNAEIVIKDNLESITEDNAEVVIIDNLAGENLDSSVNSDLKNTVDGQENINSNVE